MASNPYVNKVSANGSTLIDLTGDTLTSSDQLMSGVVAHARSGATITGSVSFVTYHTSSSNPTSAQGSDGDIWLVTS